MTQGSRRLGAGLVTTGCAGVLGFAAVLNAPFAAGADDTALILGYAGAPNPDQYLPDKPYLTDVMNYFIDPANPFPGQTVFAGYNPVIQYTPMTDYQQGLTQGVEDLHQGILDNLANGGKVTVFGYSESASVVTQEMVNLGAMTERPDPSQLSFVLVEALNNPNGGIVERFAGWPGLDLPATPADTPYSTEMISIEYGGVADFPKYPLNLLALLNATSGYMSLHPFLLPGWPTTFDPSSLANAVELPTSEGYDGATDYFLIPTMDLPLLAGLRGTPVIGPAMADLIQPALRVLIDLGYDRTDPADVVTPAVLTFPNIDWDVVSQNLELGWQQGLIAAQVDLGMLPQSALPDMYPYLPDVTGLASGAIDTGLLPDDPTAAAADLGGGLDFSSLLSELSNWFSTAFML